VISLSELPALNAGLNSLSALFLFTGFWAIKNKNESLHKKLMVSAFVTSALFLASYLYYHFHHPTTKFPDLGWIKTVYLIILFTHIVLAVVMLPMIFMTFYHAFKDNREKHRKIARLTFPIWSYVSVTGVLIYFMLYQWFR
jgi:putative membrane protein